VHLKDWIEDFGLADRDSFLRCSEQAKDNRDQYRGAVAHQSHRQRRKGDGLTAKFRRFGDPKCMRGQSEGEAADRWVADADEAQQRRRDVRPAPLSDDIVVAVPIDAVIDAAGSPFTKHENSVLHAGRAAPGKPYRLRFIANKSWLVPGGAARYTIVLKTLQRPFRVAELFRA
jgi:hypothetical protein